MKLWIDADAAPRDVKEVVFRAAKRLKLPTVLVANGPLDVPSSAATVTAVQVAAGANVADRYIVVHSSPGDIVVTADIPLAADLVEKGVSVVDPRGGEYTPDNIRSRLAARDFFDSARGAGLLTSGSPPYSLSDKKLFADTLDRVLTRAIKAAGPQP